MIAHDKCAAFEAMINKLERQLEIAVTALDKLGSPCPVIEENYEADLSPDEEADIYFESSHRRRVIAIEACKQIKSVK